MDASVLVMLGVLLGARVDRRFLALPIAVFSFFGQHALQGWCPPIPLFRRLGVRTHREIARKRYALKALRGDFDDLPPKAQAPQRACGLRWLPLTCSALAPHPAEHGGAFAREKPRAAWNASLSGCLKRINIRPAAWLKMSGMKRLLVAGGGTAAALLPH